MKIELTDKEIDLLRGLLDKHTEILMLAAEIVNHHKDKNEAEKIMMERANRLNRLKYNLLYQQVFKNVK